MAKAVTRRAGHVAPIRAAVEEVCGAAMVLDADLRVVLATPMAETLLGFEVTLGAIAPRLICGESTDRPMAEALAAGRAAQAVIPRPTKHDEHRKIRVRSVPLGPGRPRAGWLLLFEEAVGAASEGAVELLGMWTQDVAMKRMFRIVERVAQDDVTVLVRGETGAGKELVARASTPCRRAARARFVAINCAALPENLLESELFGHARGSFTGAVKDTPGHVQMAHRGTPFLDEVADMPLARPGEAPARRRDPHGDPRRRARANPRGRARRLRHAPLAPQGGRGRPLPRRPHVPPSRHPAFLPPRAGARATWRS